ncbi:MAG: hypothetical protein PHR06_14140 [Candidatus Cloacimonetes bacterium]|nr:hypothetical protein [Candidatus Cloacimonadota bacterium]
MPKKSNGKYLHNPCNKMKIKKVIFCCFRNKRVLKPLIVFALFSFFLILSAEDMRPYRLINSDDVTIRKNKSGYYTTHLTGNVHFFYGNTEFFSDKAILRDLEKTADLIGNVEVYEDTLALYAKTVTYYRLEEKIILRDSVFFKETHRDSTIRTFQSDYVEYLREKRNLIAKGQVNAYDERESVFGNCGYLTYDLNSGYGYLIEEPEVFLRSDDSLSIKAQKIDYYKDCKKVVANFDVVTKYKKNTVLSDFAIYMSENSEAIFLGQPYFSSSYADAYSQEMHLFFDEENIHQATLLDSCRLFFSTEEYGEKDNKINANRIKIDFLDGAVKTCFAFENVRSYYQQKQEEKKDFLINQARGEELVIFINDDKEVDRIELKQKVNGSYKFMTKQFE